MAKNKIQHSTALFEVQLTNLEEVNPYISRYKCYIAYPNDKNTSANGYIFSKEILEEMIPSIIGCPVKTYYSEKLDQFGGHEGQFIVKNGKIDRTKDLQAIGFADYTTKPFWEKLTKDGVEREYLTCVVYLWNKEQPLLKDLSKYNIYQSMECATDYEEINGFRFVTKAEMNYLVLIGNSPAFKGSTFAKFSNEFGDDFYNIENLKLELEKISKFNYDMDIIDIIKNKAVTKSDVKIEEKEINVNAEFSVPKEDWGTGETLEIDKSIESLSNDSWGDIDKTKLKWDILKAKNYKTLINSVYLRVGSDWENSPSNDLSYPVMQIKGEKVVYNAGGLSSALGFARANNETEIIRKALQIRKKLKIGEEERVKSSYVKMKNENVPFSAIFTDGTASFIDTELKVCYQVKDNKFSKFSCVDKFNADAKFEDVEIEEDDKECECNEFAEFICNKIANYETMLADESRKSLEEINKKVEEKEAEIGKMAAAFSEKETLLNEKIEEANKIATEKSTAFSDKENEISSLLEKIATLEKDKRFSETEKFLTKNVCFSVFDEKTKTELLDECVKFSKEEYEEKIWAKFGRENSNSSNVGSSTGKFTYLGIDAEGNVIPENNNIQVGNLEQIQKKYSEKYLKKNKGEK